MNSRRYWYYKMNKYFWDDIKIINMLNIPMYGEKMTIILLKLYSYSVEYGGVLNIENMISEHEYISRLADICRVDIKVMTLAVEYFKKEGFIEVLHSDKNSTYCEFPYVKSSTGSITEDGLRKREYRERLKMQEKKQLESGEVKSGLGFYENIYIYDSEVARLKEEYLNADTIINFASLSKKDNGDKFSDIQYINQAEKIHGKKKKR